jgi:Co/Zn/Cd efflux system component
VLTTLVTIAELVLAQATHSITLLVLVHQNIYNVITLVVSCVTRVKGDRSLKNTFGWRRIEVVGSIASLVFLFSLCFATMIEALQTVFHTSHLDTMHHPKWIMVLVGGHVAVWLVSFFVIGGYSYHQSRAVRQEKPSRLHARAEETVSACSSFMKTTRVMDVTRDLCGCVFTFLTCSLVYYQVVTEDYSAYLDPIISMVYIVFLIWTCLPLVKESCLILLQTIPGK